MGSVKNLIILKQADTNNSGIGRFIFSDRYSVFDWGEMPDHIADKGKAICIATSYFFERLEEIGIKTHYTGVKEKDGEVKRLNELNAPSNTIEFKLIRVIKPDKSPSRKGDENHLYDYSVYKQEKTNFLIPLEVIYRNSLPEGSSVFKRLKEGSLKLEDIWLNEMPRHGQVLEKPIIDVSTKLEEIDRYISWQEAIEMGNLTQEEIEEIKRITLLINNIITTEASRFGLFNEDGKIEFGFDENRNIILVDALGTLDECRFTYNGMPISKEIARIFYRNTYWHKDIELAKKIDRVNWKNIVKTMPKHLPKELADSISLIYKSYANELTGRKWFDAPALKEILETLLRMSNEG